MSQKSSSHNNDPSAENRDERREFFRVEDDVLLKYQVIDQENAIHHVAPEDFMADIGYSLVRELQQIDYENSKLLRSIAETNRDIEQYLKNTDKKINLIANRLANVIKPPNQTQAQKVSLSEGGIAFRSTKALHKDSYLAVQLSFISSNVSLVLFAKVIHCNNNAGQDYFTTATSFIGLSDSDRQILAKHVMQIQLMNKRNPNSDS